MPRPYVLRRKICRITKPHAQDNSCGEAYFQVMLKFHEGLLSIVKSIFVCLFVFAATPIAILAGNSIDEFKQHIPEIVRISGEMLLYCLVLFLFYILFVRFFDLKPRNVTYLAERLRYMNSLMAFLSLFLLSIASVRCLYLCSSLMKLIL